MVITSQSSSSPFGPTTKLAPPSQSSFGFGLPTSSGIGTVFGVPNTDFKSTLGFGNPSNASATSSIFGVSSPAFPTGFTMGTSNAFPSTTLGFGENSNHLNASTTSSIFGVSSPAFPTGFTTGTSNAFPSTTLGFGENSNQSNASTTSSIFGVSSPAFPTGFTTGTSNVFGSTTLGFGKHSNQSNASATSSIFGAPSSAFTTGLTTGTSNAFQSTGFGINSNSFGVSNNLPAFATGCSTGTSHAFPSMTSGFSNNSTNTSGFRFGIKSSTESQGVTKQKPTTGSRKVPYSANRVGVERLQSISGMLVYEAKSHEELRLEDYELKHNSKGDGCDTSVNIFRNPNNNNLFEPPIKSTTSSTISTFVPSSSPFPQTSPFNTQSLPAFINQNTTTVPSPNPFSLPKTNPNPSQPQPFVPSSANPNPFPPFPSNVPINTCNQFPPVSPMAFTNSHVSTTVSPSTTSLPALGTWSFIPNTSQPAVKSDFHFPENPSQPSHASSSSTSAAKVGYPHINVQQQQYVQANTVGVQSTLVADPFPTRSEIDRPNTVLTLVQHGISSLPSQVPNKLSANRSTSSLRIRHVSPRLNSLPPQQKYTTPSSSERKLAFFNDGVDRPGPFLPRENPRAWVTNSLPSHSSSGGKCCEDKDLPCSSLVLDTCIQEETEHLTTISISQQIENDDSVFVAKKHEDDVLALLPKLPNGDEYYTEPSLTELAAKEIDKPGSLSRVNDFVVGKSGYGSIKFLGETDVRHLDLGTIVQFKNREVIVYADEKTKPVVGEALNKTAEVTLLNVKCMGKKTGKQYFDGPWVESYKEMLMKKGLEQGTEFVSYDPVRGEWRFRVQHF